MSEATSRIRWSGDCDDIPKIIGRVGELDADLFAIYPPDKQSPSWLLAVRVPGVDTRFTYGDSADEMKRLAEERLVEFVSSLGAIFPEAAALPARDEHHHLDLTCGACEEEFGTNCDDDDIRCAVCSAHRCPHCGGWFGED